MFCRQQGLKYAAYCCFDGYHTQMQDQDNFDADARRQEQRRAFSAHATVQVMESNNKEYEGITMETTIVEISPHGLRLSCDRFLAESKLGIWLDLADDSENFFLTADIRWADWYEGRGYQIGAQLVANPLADMERWHTLWEESLSQFS